MKYLVCVHKGTREAHNIGYVDNAMIFITYVSRWSSRAVVSIAIGCGQGSCVLSNCGHPRRRMSIIGPRTRDQLS